MSLRVANAAPCRSLSRVLWLVGVVFGPLLDISGIYFYVYCVATALIRPTGRRVEHVDNHQPVVGCKPVFLRVDGCCCAGVLVPTTFSCYEIKPVVLGDEKMSERVFMMLPRECLVFELQDC